MDDGYFPHAFEGPIERYGVGASRKIWYRALFLPDRLRAVLPLARHPRLRVVGEIADVPMAGAFIPTGDGRHHVIVSPAVLAAAEVGIGDRVEMRFRVDDQDRVDSPDELLRAIKSDASAALAWDRLTPGLRRGLCHRIASAKGDATRKRRVDELIAQLHAGTVTLRTRRS